MPKLIDLTGKKFGRWTVLSKGESDGSEARWNCVCDCGSERLVKSYSLRAGASTSCGCAPNYGRLTHGHNKKGKRTGTYQTWRDMKRRCEDSKHIGFHNYGGKGIKVCERWQSFENFLSDMGNRPKGKNLDRIDSEGGYCPENCRWITQKEQTNNMSRNHYLEFNGKRMTISEWADELGMPYNRLNTRIHRGWSIERALTT